MADQVPSERNYYRSQTFERLDAIDLSIIAQLQGSARLHIAELDRRVGLSWWKIWSWSLLIFLGHLDPSETVVES